MSSFYICPSKPVPDGFQSRKSCALWLSYPFNSPVIMPRESHIVVVSTPLEYYVGNMNSRLGL